VKPDTINNDEMKKRLQAVWEDFSDSEFITGQQIIRKLFSSSASRKQEAPNEL